MAHCEQRGGVHGHPAWLWTLYVPALLACMLQGILNMGMPAAILCLSHYAHWWDKHLWQRLPFSCHGRLSRSGLQQSP